MRPAALHFEPSESDRDAILASSVLSRHSVVSIASRFNIRPEVLEQWLAHPDVVAARNAIQSAAAVLARFRAVVSTPLAIGSKVSTLRIITEQSDHRGHHRDAIPGRSHPNRGTDAAPSRGTDTVPSRGTDTALSVRGAAPKTATGPAPLHSAAPAPFRDCAAPSTVVQVQHDPDPATAHAQRPVSTTSLHATSSSDPSQDVREGLVHVHANNQARARAHRRQSSVHASRPGATMFLGAAARRPPSRVVWLAGLFEQTRFSSPAPLLAAANPCPFAPSAHHPLSPNDLVAHPRPRRVCSSLGVPAGVFSPFHAAAPSKPTPQQKPAPTSHEPFS